MQRHLLLLLVWAGIWVGKATRVLVLQNRGGGHGSIGFHLCRTIKGADPATEVLLVQDKGCDYEKAPFSSYSELKAMGVEVVDADIANDPGLGLGSGIDIDYMVDNWSKKEEHAALVAGLAKQTGTKQLLFVSSAGMYEAANTSPLIEADSVKANNGARKIEEAYVGCGIPYTFLRPQYIYGEKSNKRYLDYFIGRADRNLPIPLPLSSEQLVCLTHVEDVAELIKCAIGHDAAQNEVFNCGTDRYITYKSIAQLVHRELGSQSEDMRYLYFDPKLFSSVQFPFRRETFITSPGKAKRLLKWAPKHKLQSDMKQEIEDYKMSKESSREWTMKDLRADLEILASKDSEFMFTYPFFDDEPINTEKRPYAFER